ncbi:YL1 nuclear protein-domain-containing protein [Cokeromyces recurvatus]|uniref:YL1 nuclear protein-domain-containing protein n=1 Tax=Cokeromyces recurvatus TaxID=90255 RepID=UPI00221FFB8B|nr:YL1 nuclear protein-domain-containing protein [Cokeromyces recurvatus]KAI7902834.1 YL1 nuclear protein-domain-containing protein [Cokeromyces recurvatus]
MSFVQERQRRPNAGSRMQALLNQEVEMEELFEHEENEEEDEEFISKVEEEEEDKLDSDFDLESSEGEQEYVEEGKQMDKALAQAERKTRRTTIFKPPVSTGNTVKKSTETKKRKLKNTIPEEERSTRYSSRKNTVLNRILVEDQIREYKRKKALQPKKDKPVVNKLTQEELLAEAAITEEKNKNSLLEWQQKEAERKENAKKKDKKEITGPFVRYYSFKESLPQQEQSEDLNENEWMGRNLISFVSEKNEDVTQSHLSSLDKDMTDLDKSLEYMDLIEELNGWLTKAPKPSKPVLCLVTGNHAKYRDPRTNVPYSNREAYNIIQDCLHHKTNWSSTYGLYLGNLPSANGVPDEWQSMI